MRLNSKKYIIAGSLLATILVASMKHGEDSSYSSQDHSSMIKECPSPKDSADTLKKITTCTNRNTIGVTTAPASPILQKPTGYFSIDALLMNVSYDWNDVYNKINDDFDALTASGSFDSSAHPYEFGWNWGVQAAAGFRVSPDAWDLNLDFTYLTASKTNRAQSTPGSSEVISNNGYFGTIMGIRTPFSEFKQTSQFTYYDGDINLSREFFVSKRLSLMPYAGAKGVYVAQNFSIHGTTFFDADNLFPNSSSYLKNNYWGVGPQVGTGIRFGFTKHFSLNFQVDGALLWGKVFSSQKINIPDASYGNLNLYGNRYQVVPNANVLANFIYDINACDDKVNFALHFGYESRYYFSNLQANTILNRSSGSTSIQGFNLGLRASY